MMIEGLQSRFGIPGMVSFGPGHNGLPKMELIHPSGAGAEIYLHGAHVTSWKNQRGEELFFLSRESHFAPGKPIRGGIPVIFPQFGGGPLPQHGLARVCEWLPEQAGVEKDGPVKALFRLSDSPAILDLWPHPFVLELGVALDAETLTIACRVRNSGEEPFDFQSVLHTYFRVADIERAAVHGLAGVTYIDSLREDLREVETRAAIRFAEETDRIYVDAPDILRLEDEGNARAISIQKSGMPDVVVWNPWIAKARRMPDFGDDEYRGMVCVETGNMAHPRPLEPGDEWYGETIFTVS